MMTAITTTTEVARPPEEVFAYVTDPARFAEWQQGVISGHMDSHQPHTVGAKCMTTRRIGGADRLVTSEVTHVDPPRSWGVRGLDGPIRASVGVTVTPVNDGQSARIEIELDFTGHGIGKLLVPLIVRPNARKEMSANIARLKQQVELNNADRKQARTTAQATAGSLPTGTAGPDAHE
jgi:uncharacterized protein YndB with AHSA1/START domain